ncbi:MAG: hypothetical protein J0M17_08475 [Planctomycetes bacterium]|nr:hypothetical protein [Planctomycetota bacterium]
MVPNSPKTRGITASQPGRGVVKQPPTAASPRSSPSRDPGPPRRRSTWRWWLLLPAALLPAIGVYAYLELWPREVCRRLEVRLADCRVEEVSPLVAQLESCRAVGVPARVRLLGSARAEVAEAARLSLNASIARLTAPDWPQNDAELEAIAEELERLVAFTSAGVPQPVVAWAWDLLEVTGRLSLDARLPAKIRGRFIAACNELLQRPELARPAAVAAAAKPQPVQAAVAPKTSIDWDALIRQEALEPGPTGAPSSAVAEVARVPAPAVPPALPISVASKSAPNMPARVNPIRDPASESAVQPASLTLPTPVLSNDAPASRPVLPPAGYSTRTAWSLFAELADSEHGPSARGELLRRGFTEAELELGRHLTSPDAAERLHYVQRLPSLAGSSLKPWLLHLAGDSDSGVRQACLSIMATNADPEIQARVRELAFTDGDEAVRQTAERVLGGKSQRR